MNDVKEKAKGSKMALKEFLKEKKLDQIETQITMEEKQVSLEH
mgnify:CR=1 FL=1